MKVQETVKRETLNIAAGTVILTGVMLLVFAILGKMDVAVILGGVLGCAAAVLDFFLLGLTVQGAAAMQAQLPASKTEDVDENGEPIQTEEQRAVLQKIRQKMQLSQMGRMVMLVAVAAVGAVAPCFHLVATVVPFLFPKAVIYVRTLLQKK